MATSSSCSDHDRGSSEDDLLIAGRPAAASAKRKMLLPATTEDSFSEDDPSTRKKARKPLGKKTKPTTVQTALRRKKRKLPPATEGSEDESKSSKENRAAAASMEEAEFVSGTRVLEYMRVAYTGARIGDLLEGTNPVTKGALMRVCQSNILPMKRKLNKIRAEPALWRAFLRQLGTLAFFANMTEVERGIWLAEHEQGKERMGSEDDEDLNSVRFQILGLGSSVLASDVISPSDVDQLMEDNPREWQGVDVARMIPANNESNSSTEGGRHTLFFIKGWWKISTDAQIIPSFEGPTIDLARGALSLGNAVEAAAASTQLFRIEGLNVEGASEEDRLPIAVRVPIGAPVVTKFDSLIDSHILPLWCSFDESSRVELVRAQVQFVQRQLNRYAASALKSLLQKLIRFPSRQVTEFFPKALQMTDGQLMELEEERKKETLAACRAIDTRLVLLVTSCMLLGKPMSFNPDIGRQVSGLESFLKRLAIILFEDSSFDDEGASALSLMAGALMAQRVRSWRPTSALLSQWLRTALQAWATPLCFRYDIEAGAAIEPYAIGLNTTAIQATSALLDALKSFPGDLAMVRFIASKPDVAVLRFNAGVAGRNRDAWHGFQNLPIYHAWDQHCAANIGYFFDPQLVRRLCATSPPGKPFSALFERLFKEVTGANPRRTVLEQETFEALPFVAATRAAQRRVLEAELVDPLPRPTVADAFEFEYELDTSWLAGMVGVIELKPRAKNLRKKVVARPALLVTLCSDDPSELIVIRKPARNLKDEDAKIPEAIEEEAIAEAREILAQGVPLRSIPAPVPQLKVCSAVWDVQRNEYWIVTKNGRDRTLWNEMRHLKLQVPVHSRIESDADEVALSYHGDGIQERAIQGLEELIAAPPEPVLNRVLYYLDTFNRDVALNDIARDGAGMEYQVNLWDAFTYRWLLRFSTLFPGALRPIPHRLNCFIVPNGPLLWFLFGRIQTLVKNRRNEQRTNAAFGHAAAAANGDGGQWNYTAWRSPFAPWLHQQEAVRDMEVRREKGRRNHYLHAPMGAGKTLIVSLYILHLAQRGLLPRHIVWTLPGEAIESVSGELNAFGFQVDWMLPQKDSSKKVIPEGVTKQANVQGLRPHVITLIEHDDLRKLPDLLRSLADELFIVVDEVHKTLAATQRTTITLEIARLARGGCVAMTGTPTVDNKIYKLVPWLSLMVRFPVNLRNFWAACNSMVSQQVDTGIRVHMQEVEAQWTSREEEQRYRSLVPDKLGGTNSHASQKDIDQAKKLCYNACTQHMVQLTLDLLHDKLHYGKVEQWKGGVFLEAKDEQHQNELIAALVRESRKRDDVRVLTEGDIFKITGGASLHLTDKTVALGEVKDYPIVITTTRKSAGYTLSRLKAFVSLVYPSNLATRLQLAGRLNRLSQAAKELDYYKVHIGLLTSILHYHDQAASIDKALKDMGVRIPT